MTKNQKCSSNVAPLNTIIIMIIIMMIRHSFFSIVLQILIKHKKIQNNINNKGIFSINDNISNLLIVQTKLRATHANIQG